MREFFKTVPASPGGKTVNKMQGEIIAMQMTKAAINGKALDRRLLLQFVEAHEAREARREELRLRKQAEASHEIDWDAEREEVYQRLRKATAEIVQSNAPDKDE